MSRALAILVLAISFPSVAAAQVGGRGGYGGRGRDDSQRRNVDVQPTEAPVSEAQLDPPMAPADFRQMFKLSDDQAKQYAQVYDSFTTVTKAQRDSAHRALDRLRAAALSGDRGGIDFHVDLLKDFSKALKNEQRTFDERMKKMLTKDQAKEYNNWRKRVESAPKAPLPGPGGRSGRG